MRSITRKTIVGYAIFCPACKCAHVLDNRWTFNGNMEKPTFRDSIAINTVGYVCHSYVTDGMIQFLADCTHDLKGQTVPLQEF